MDRNEITPQEATAANADIWARYFEQEWGRWLTPFGGPSPEAAQTTAAQVAGFLTLVAAGPIAWMFAANAPQVRPLRPTPAPAASASASQAPAAA